METQQMEKQQMETQQMETQQMETQRMETQSVAKRGFARAAAAALLICGGTMAAGALGGASSKPGVWYRRLRKPTGTPPNAVFPIVWTALYASMAYSAWRVWKAESSTARTRSLALWASQLGLNAAWSPVFFGAHRPKAALGVIAVLLPNIAAYT
jgi:tryptophan-rich sensory protein